MTAWERWEDYRAGFYRPATGDTAGPLALLSDPDAFYETAREMVREWPASAKHNLSYMWTGRNAWIGQAACVYSLSCTAADVRLAWGQMSNAQQRAANKIAVRVRDEWERSEADAQVLPGL